VQLTGRGGIDGDHVSEKFQPKRVDVAIDNSGTIADLVDKATTLARDLSWIA
jgi:hypothetical protein